MVKEKYRHKGVTNNENHMGEENIDTGVLFIMKIIWVKKIQIQGCFYNENHMIKEKYRRRDVIYN